MTNERIRMALKESARPMEALSIRFVEDQNLWIMIFEEERPIFLAARGRDSHWVLSAPIGEPPEIATDQFSDLLMIYKGQPELSAGFRIGLDEPAGMLKLSIDLGPADLEPEGIKTMIGELRKCRQIWGLLADNWQPAAARDAVAAPTISPGNIA